MTRTKKYLAYFGRSFLKDKVAITFILLILVCIIGIIVVAILPSKDKKLLLASEDTAPLFLK